MPKIARGRGTGASSVTSASGNGLARRRASGRPTPGGRRRCPRRSSRPRSPRTSPARGSVPPGGMKVASRIGGLDPRRIADLRCRRQRRQWLPWTRARSRRRPPPRSATYRSFADATRSVLDLLERHLPESVLYLAHLDRAQFIHRIVDARNGSGVGLRSNLAIPLGDAFARTWRRTARRACATRSAATRSTRRCRCRSASAPARTSACRSSCPTARASARWPRCATRSRRSPRTTSSSS